MRVARTCALAVGLALMAAPALPAAAAPAKPACTIVGTPGPDTLRGTAARDVICGLAGNDRIMGLAGNDLLFGGAGDDWLMGGAGNDELLGGAGADMLMGEAGNDKLMGGAGEDGGSGGPGTNICSSDAAIEGCRPVEASAPEAGPDAQTPAEDAPAPGSPSIRPADPEAGPLDTENPVLSRIDIPATATAGEPLTLRWSVSDASSVTTLARVGGRNGWAAWCFDQVAQPVSGAGTRGDFVQTCTPPADTPVGTYTAFIVAADAAGNRTEAQVDFQITGGSADVDPPAILAGPSMPSVQPGGSFTLRWALADPSGVSFTTLWVYTPRNSLIGFDGLPGSTSGAPVLVSGDERNGVWEQTFSLSPDAPVGSYWILMSIRDTVGNRDAVQVGSFEVAAPSERR